MTTDENLSMTPDNDKAPQRRKRPRKGPIVGILLLLFLLAGIGAGAWWYLFLRFEESTDDAYVAGNVLRIMPQVSGKVVAVDVDDNDMVAAGQTLVRLDPVDARLAYERSLVALASAVRDNCRLQAQLRETEAAIRMRRVDLRQKADNLTRREALGKAKAIGAEELKHARDDRENAAVALAAANVRDCWLALQRTTVLSPAAGQIAKRGVQAGEVVSPGTPLMTVIPLHRLWIDANFKEVQLHKMRIGQPAVIRVDMYGGDVTYHGRVTGFSAGTGSAFSLLPPQNATGNWIKIVQRVPVRIEIDPADLREHPLLVGLSAVVKVDTSDTSGRLLAASARTEPVPGDLVSQAPAVDFAPVEATISGIIRDNALPGVCPVQGKP